MNTNSKRLGIYITLMLLLTSAAVALRTVACIGSLNFETGYFKDGALTVVSTPLIWGTVLFSLTYIFAASRISLRPSFSTAATYIPSGLVGVAGVFLGSKVLLYALKAFDKYPIISQETLGSPVFLFSVVAFALSIVSVGYHFFNTYNTESKLSIRALFAVSTIAFFAVYAMLIYFDESLPINNSGKIVNQMAYLFAAIFFLYETRISLGREQWRLYAAFGLAATALCAYSSIPSIITYYATGSLPFGAHTGAFISMEEYVLTLALCIFILSRLILTATLKEEKENEYIRAMADFAKERNSDVEESFGRFQEDFARRQMSIFELYGDEDVTDKEVEAENSEDTVAEEEPQKEITISDDLIYEAIFGKMPDKEDDESNGDVPEEVTDTRDPEEIAEEILNTVQEAEKMNKEEK